MCARAGPRGAAPGAWGGADLVGRGTKGGGGCFSRRVRNFERPTFRGTQVPTVLYERNIFRFRILGQVGQLRTRSVTVPYRTPMLTVWVSDSLSFFTLLNAHNFQFFIGRSLVPVLSYKRRVRLSVDVVSLAVYLVVFRCSVT